MKTFLTMTAVVALGVAITTAVSLARMGTPMALSPLSLDLPAEPDAAPPISQPGPAIAADAGAKPLAVAEETEYDFGNLRNKTMDNRHTFQIRNDGAAPLKLTGSRVSCDKCTFVDFPQTVIQPGQTGEVVVRWNVDTFEDHFRQSATIKTDDPDHEEIRLVISGKVVRPLQAEPANLVLSNVQVGKEAQGKVRLRAYFSDHLEVVGHTLTEAATAQYFDVASAPVHKDELSPGVESAVDVTVTVKPGLPVGSFSQTLEIETSLADEPKLSIPLSGNVSGAVTIAGKDWDRDYNYLAIGHVKQSEGAKRDLYILAHGAEMKGLEFEPAEIDDPSALKVTYGKPKEMKEGTLVRMPVTIEVPPQSPLVNHMGGKEARLAQVVIPTNKSALGRVQVRVKFAVIAD
ncbi:MAG TPA: DUF1573 domain-containing protein [Pirellulales bacterium]|nr:DUF1573 domain-containing protein [Pirellulales bacterium]